MAEADKLGAALVRQLAQRYTLLTYTSLHPETPPAQASRGRESQSPMFLCGCLLRGESTPTGPVRISRCVLDSVDTELIPPRQFSPAVKKTSLGLENFWTISPTSEL